ncbi:ubiquitin carboxyl-terminal hydrolase [Nitzschia inconspicua]|uniref:Ubiquitin carboxyl-terminal hydrolase n=1 Tax=Nitzschia inconspicua TaxID=303405 RepID=A0A9K3PR64_9STRA|nr:ubiquitin carboxyl-terminal hydrolase [Nitzschia inconspicua]
MMSDNNNNGTDDDARKRKSDAISTTNDPTTSCPYLDTIQRSLLDFDFEPSCSVSLETGPHVYCCLVCGKFFRGRGKQTPAYTHSVDEGHFVFVHLSKGTFHCLPDNYEIKDPSLADISAALHPTFTEAEIQSIDSNTGLARDFFGRRYLPGYVGLSNAGKTDYINSTVQALAHVKPLRDYFLRMNHTDVFVVPTQQPSNHKTNNTHNTTHNNNNKRKPPKAPHRMSDLVQNFGELVRKMWSDKRFKSNVDPHMLVQAISRTSKKKFQVGQQAELGEFMAWFLNQLHIGLGGTRKPESSIIYKIFQGKVEVVTKQGRRTPVSADTDETALDPATTAKVEVNPADVVPDGDNNKANGKNGDKVQDKENSTSFTSNEWDETSTVETNFLQLTLDIPEKPLFRDEDGGLVIPQEPLVTVMKKFDGVSFSEALTRSGVTQRKRYRLVELPPYLILHLARFKTNNYSREKNPTIVAFPVKNLDLGSYTFPKNERKPLPTENEVRSMDVKELRAILKEHGRDDIATKAVEKSDLMEATVDFVCKSLPDLLADKYDLVANITHDSPADVGREGKHDPLQEGSYKCHVQHKVSNQWYEIQDLHVQETMPQLIGVSESYLLIFERKSAQQTDLSR